VGPVQVLSDNIHMSQTPDPRNPLAPPAAPELTAEQLATMTPEEKDRWWFQNVYAGDRMPQLTWRAVIMGGFLGMAMSAANLYTTLSIGWAFGIAITACVLSFVIWNFVRFCSGNSLSQMSVLENACMASTASAAGYATGSTIATMFGALVLLVDPPAGVEGPEAIKAWSATVHTWDVTKPWIVVVFTLCTGLMGVFLAIPMKRQMINHEQLPFPSGTAAAETLRSLYSQSVEAMHKAYVLVAGLAAGLLIGFLRVDDSILDAVGFLKRLFSTPFRHFRIPTEFSIHVLDRLYPGGRHPAGMSFEPSALLIAAGMIVGMRISVSLVLSSLVLYGGVGPWLARMDAAQMEQGAATVLAAAQNAAKSQASPRAAADAAIAAVGVAAEGLGIDPAPLKATAQRTAETALKDVETEGDAAKARDDVATAIGHAVMPGAASAYADRAASRESAAAREAAIKSGATPEAAEAAATLAFNQAKYKPTFRWDWGGGVITLMRWSLWGGTALMVFSSLTSVGLQWRTIGRAFVGVKGGERDHTAGRMLQIEVPGKWMIMGMVPITIAMVWLQIQAFHVSWYAGLIAVGMSFVLSLVACRATGETDTTPIGAMGKVMQLLFAGLAPNNIAANLASAGIAANSASSSADLLTDLKTGYLLGANPRKQFLAQFIGVFFGTVAIVPIWYLMVPTKEKLERFALPSTRSWEAVARVLTKGISELPASATYAILIGATIGVVLPIIERLLSPKARRFMPSAMGIGLAWIMPFQNAFSFFVGAVIALLWARLSPRRAEKYNVAVASGLIAGESLMAAALAITATVIGLLTT
jgi:uncharacterized oligopeptide transporter (OPT) family protein